MKILNQPLVLLIKNKNATHFYSSLLSSYYIDRRRPLPKRNIESNSFGIESKSVGYNVPNPIHSYFRLVTWRESIDAYSYHQRHHKVGAGHDHLHSQRKWIGESECNIWAEMTRLTSAVLCVTLYDAVSEVGGGECVDIDTVTSVGEVAVF